MAKKEINMTEGNPFRKMLTFAIPITAGGLLQQMYSMADAVIAGRFIGSDALAAISNCFYIIFLVTILFLGLGHGASIIISQMYGSGDVKRVSCAVDTSVVLLTAGGLICTVAGVALAGRLLELMSTPAELMEDSAAYLRIIFAGSIPSLGYTIIAALLNAVGNSRTPLALLGAASLLNIALDLIFVPLLGMGIEGLALATVIAQSLSLAGCIIYLNRSDSLISLRLRGFQFSWKMLLLIVRLGLPTGLQNSLMVISMMVLQREINHFGIAVMAGRGIESKIESFMLIPLGSIGTAVTTFVGQNTGAGKEERVTQGLKNGFIMAAALSLLFWLVLALFSDPILSLFSSNEAALFEARRCMDIIAPTYIFYSLAVAWQSFFRGVGDTVFPLIVSIFTQFAYRILAIDQFLKIWPTPSGIWYLYVSSWALMFLLDSAYYRTGIWKKYAAGIRKGL
ncbi:MAG: MATE family efflux transporter [Synergistaceae bacterium]|nr:MATE family efflux transporter [Synergistaceae bacterium]